MSNQRSRGPTFLNEVTCLWSAFADATTSLQWYLEQLWSDIATWGLLVKIPRRDGGRVNQGGPLDHHPTRGPRQQLPPSNATPNSRSILKKLLEEMR